MLEFSLNNYPNIKKYIQSVLDRRDCFVITAGYLFEPHGRASETWEETYVLSFPHIPYYYYLITGWETKGESKMYFQGRTLENIFKQAEKFLAEVNYIDRN